MEIPCRSLFLLSAISIGYLVAGQTKFENVKSHPAKSVCSDIEITDKEGVITSPSYPTLYTSHLSCSWHIIGNVGDVITVWFDDIDIEETCTLFSSPCCLFNWLKFLQVDDGSEKIVCGKTYKYDPIVSSSHKLLIKFHISKFIMGGRGFQIHYKMSPRYRSQCNADEIQCDTDRCIPKTLRCNGYPDCEDGTDESQCTSAFQVNCKTDELRCNDGHCIPINLRCNKIPDCEDGSDEHHCSDKCSFGLSCRSAFHCYNKSQHCDGKADCSDFSDEMDCGFCSKNLIRCGPNSTECYNPLSQRCDKIFHCLNGEDEKNCDDNLCPGKIMCDSRRGCYPLKHRCNGVAQCEDASDEKNCVPELCNYEHGGFLCDNRRCIQQVWTCDRTDDCGDGSDERNCLRNSVLTAAVMGSLICALLLVIAISCTCRLHALRMLEHRLTSRETPLSRLSREFFFREPPPSYAVAVQGSQHHNLYVENLHYGAPVHRGRRRGRRSRHSRGTVTAPQLASVSRNCVIVDPDGTPIPLPVDLNSNGETSTSLPSPNPSSVVIPKDDCEISVSGDTQSILQDTASDKSHSSNTCPVIRPTSDSESLCLEPINGSFEETSDSVQNVSSDHFYCDSDSEPLVP